MLTNTEQAPSTIVSRLSTLAVSTTGIAAAGGLLVLTWISVDTPLLERLNETTWAGSSILLLGLAILIALKAADKAANVSMALAIAFVFSSTNFARLLFVLGWDSALAGKAVAVVIFFLGAALYIRATQLFPRRLTEPDIVHSPTLWGRVRLFRSFLTALLDRRLAWLSAACCTFMVFFSPVAVISEAARLSVILIGIVFMYVTYRSGDEESRRKVLWFFEAALAALVFGLIFLGLHATLGDSLTPDMRAVLSLGLNTAYILTLLVCFAAAVFYAGAVSPALVVRKTLVYGATVVVLLFTFAAVQSLVTNVIVDYFEVTDHLGSAMVGAIFGLLFHPLTQRTERLLRKFGVKETAPPDSVPATIFDGKTTLATELSKEGDRGRRSAG